MSQQGEFEAAAEQKAKARVEEAAKEARAEQEAKDKAKDLARENEMKAAKKRMTELDTGLTKLGKLIKELSNKLKKEGLDQETFLKLEEKLYDLMDQ